MSATPSPSAEAAAPDPEAAPAARRARSLRSPVRGLASLRRRLARRLRRLQPRTFQARLTVAFTAVVAGTLLIVAMLVINRVGVYFDQQQHDDLEARANAVGQYIIQLAQDAPTIRAGKDVVTADGIVDPAVVTELSHEERLQLVADRLAQADVQFRLGLIRPDGSFEPAANGLFFAKERADAEPGQLREHLTSSPFYVPLAAAAVPYEVEVTLVNPYTFRAAAIANVTGLLAIIGLVALLVAVVVAAAVARRFTTPLRRLTEASQDLAEGDLARRVPHDVLRAGATELVELGLQFNAMAERLQESVEIIRRDRDRSREFLADVSHELRTPIAALRTFNELLVEGAAEDPMTRAEFLESSRAQLERLDWLALNLLELSKLDSGLLLLDLRPEDLRATVEQAVEQAAAAARRRSIELTVDVPDEPVPIRHDPVRVGQVVTNLVGNGLKFTARGGRVQVRVRALPEGAEILVADTGIGIDPVELPRIFDRFYRGSRATEARGSGSGLGLAIVRSIVEMHGGTVTVESRLGEGSRFRVELPAVPPSERVAETSSSEAPNRNAAAAR
ncbi:MAG TPA: HAMP domain-containing sensor histidine kinase [Candidatus Limnocylindrales bacterium]|nr:HAMP domain-containing sensor histidine kinase [Candidatus Limnocylindrales bacterium]